MLNCTVTRVLCNCALFRCIPRPKEPDLHVAEMACLDRCVPKFVEVHELVGKEIAEVQK